jgi:hypothetical protein
MSSLLHSVELCGPAGRLEALLTSGLPATPYAALVCHPHPPSGGTMHTKAVYHAQKAFAHLGLPTLRFNFRGVGRSEGTYDNGVGEMDDVRAALDWLAAQFHLPILCAGFSFGAVMALAAGGSDPRVRGLIALGLPVRATGRDYDYSFLAHCPQPKLFLSGDHDEFCPAGFLERTVAIAPGSSTTILIPGADHFFLGTPASPAPKLDAMRRALESWLATTFHLSAPTTSAGSAGSHSA